MATIDLFFRTSSLNGFELVEVCFGRFPGAPALRTIRGKFCYLSSAHGSFQWTRAVQALALLILRAKAFGDAPQAHLVGESSSLAASLDYAISKEPVWLHEMFGSDKDGVTFVRRILHRTNPERKRPGPVIISVNSALLPASSIRIFINQSEVTSSDSLKNLIGTFDGFPSSAGTAQEPIDNRSANFLDQAISIVERCSGAQQLKIRQIDNGIEFAFDSLTDADQSLPALLDLCTTRCGSGKQMLWYLKHCWWPLIRPLYSYKHSEISRLSGANVAYVSPSNGSSDRWAASFYSRTGIRSRLGVKPMSLDDLWTFDDYIVEQVHPEELTREIDLFFKLSEPIEQFDGVSFIRNFIEAKGDIKINIRKTEQARRIAAELEQSLRWKE